MAQRKSLTERQVAVLRWIGEGCQQGDIADELAARISAGALRNRGFARTFGRGPTWRAEITGAGVAYLAAVDGPNPPVPRQPNVSVTKQLVDDVVAAGGSLRVPRKQWYDTEGIDYARRARLAEAHGKVPRGHRLKVTATSEDELLIELTEDGMIATPGAEDDHGLASVPVPARLTKYHRVAQEFRDQPTLHEVSRKSLARALRIVHALAVEIERRGYAIECVRVTHHQRGRPEWKPSRHGQLAVIINGHRLNARIWEKGVNERGPYEEQLQRWKEDRGRPYALMQFVDRPKPFDRAASGELNISALGYSSGRQTTWGDRSRWRVEDRLSHLLRELELEAIEAEERRLTQEREQAERQRQWEQAMDDARRQLVEDHRRGVLLTRVQAWEEAERIRRYCDAVEDRFGAPAIAEHPDTAEWLALARGVADRAQEIPDLPREPEMSPTALAPYLAGWSPYGPQGW